MQISETGIAAFEGFQRLVEFVRFDLAVIAFVALVVFPSNIVGRKTKTGKGRWSRSYGNPGDSIGDWGSGGDPD